MPFNIGNRKYLRNKKTGEKYRYGAMSSRRTGKTHGHGGWYPYHKLRKENGYYRKD